MKLYVLPIGARCNANCQYCITMFRKMRNDVLSLKKLVDVLDANNYDKIEITGGGEPSLHPQIEQIIEMCLQNGQTNIYTNGNLDYQTKNVEICISRAHYDDEVNRQIMGVGYDIHKFLPSQNIKLSLMLHKSGISTLEELLTYLNWAKKFAKKVVIRQLFEYEVVHYQKYYAKEYVSSVNLAEKLGKKFFSKKIDGNYFFDFYGMGVEFEGRSCACENNNPVLGADGILRTGWNEL